MSEIIKELMVDNFALKSLILGEGRAAIVIGSHKYYPKTFIGDLKEHLQLVFTDTRGFTKAKAEHSNADFTVDKMVGDIELLRKAISKEKIIIIGHSIHAFLALEYARQYPDYVSHVVLIASSPISGNEIYVEADRYFEESVCPERKIAFANSMQKFIESKDNSFVSRLLSFGPRIWYDYNFDASKLWDGVELNDVGAPIIWGSMFAQYNVEDALRDIKCPIFLGLGRYDYFNPPHLWENYRKYSKNLRIRIFEKSGHTPQLEESDHFNAELMEFLCL